MDFEQVEVIINKIVKPYKLLSKVLGILLFVSVIGNIYLATKKVDITLIANNNKESEVLQSNE